MKPTLAFHFHKVLVSFMASFWLPLQSFNDPRMFSTAINQEGAHPLNTSLFCTILRMTTLLIEKYFCALHFIVLFYCIFVKCFPGKSKYDV